MKKPTKKNFRWTAFILVDGQELDLFDVIAPTKNDAREDAAVAFSKNLGRLPPWIARDVRCAGPVNLPYQKPSLVTAKFLSKSQIYKIFGKPSKNNPLGEAVRIRIQEMTK